MGSTPAIVWARAGGPKQPAPRPRRRSPSRDKPPWLTVQSARDVVLFLSGLVLLYHQSVVAAEAQEILVAAALALIFGPVPLRLDERRKNGANGS